MSDESMVERVARAVIADLNDRKGFDFDDLDDDILAEIRESVGRAAIAAMREPTEKMIEASNREWDGRMSARSAGVWQAMIDAALNDGATPCP